MKKVIKRKTLQVAKEINNRITLIASCKPRKQGLRTSFYNQVPYTFGFAGANIAKEDLLNQVLF